MAHNTEVVSAVRPSVGEAMTSRAYENSVPGGPGGMEDDGLEETVADVELDESLDRVEDAEAEAVVVDDELGEYDPEAGQSRIADKSSITGQIMSEAGLFVIGLCAAMLGVSVLIYAAVMQTPATLITAVVVAPLTLGWAFVKWKRWMGGAPYVYRLLLSLNEKDAADEALMTHRERERQRVAKKIEKLESRGPRVRR